MNYVMRVGPRIFTQDERIAMDAAAVHGIEPANDICQRTCEALAGDGLLREIKTDSRFRRFVPTERGMEALLDYYRSPS